MRLSAKSSWRSVYRVLATTAALLSGCGATEDQDVPDEAELEIESTESAIRLGTSGGGNGAVEIDGCSGFLVGTRMILTAAHCFDDQLGSAAEGTVQARVSYAVTGTSWRCLTGSPSNGKCTVKRDVFVRRLTGARPEQDVAAVFPFFLGTSFSNVSASETGDGFYDGSLSAGYAYTFYGRGYYHFDGTGSGVMRFMTDTLNWVGSDHFVTDADNIRVCRGDSGGPYLRSGGGRWVFGIQSTATLSSQCAEVGEKVRGSRLTSSKRATINNWRVAEGIPACTQHSSSFPNHWVCQ